MKDYPLYIIVSLVIAFLLTVVLIWPQYKKFTSLEQNIFQKESELQAQGEYFVELQKTSDNLKNYQASLAKIESALPEKGSLPELLNFLQKTASQLGLTLRQISPAVVIPDSKGEIQATRLNFSLEGNYSEFKNFLSTIEKSSRLIDVSNINFSYPEKEVSFNFNLAIIVYSY